MKDSYSFDINDESLQRSYQAHREAYVRIFDRFGFDYVIVEAMAGAMGGSASEEFLATAEHGEDTYVRCTTCDYAANVEAVTVRTGRAAAVRRGCLRHMSRTRPTLPRSSPSSTISTMRFPRDDRPWGAADTLKNVVVVLAAPGRSSRAARDRRPGRPRGRREASAGPGGAGRARRLHRGRLRRSSDAEEGVHRSRCARAPTSHPASASWSILASSTGTTWVTGADEHGRHVLDLVAGRDFTADGVIEAAEVRAGDLCPRDGGVARDRPRHRDGAHLPARPSVRRSARLQGA